MTFAGVLRATDQKLKTGNANQSSRTERTTDQHSYRPEFVYRFGPFELWPDGTLVRDSVTIPLPPKELSVLRVLVSQAGRVVSANELRKAGWGSVHVSPDSLPRCMSSLRTRFDSERTITTVYKRGYRFDFPVRVTDAGSGMARLAHPAPEVGPGLPADPKELSASQSVPDQVVEKNTGQEIFEQGKRFREHLENPRLVILPFETAFGVPDSLGARVAEESMLHLSQSRAASVDVLAYDSVSSLHKQGATAVQVGRALSAEFAIAGKVIALPIHYRLRAEMFRVADLVQLWVQDFVIPRHRIDAGVTNVAQSIGDRIRSSFLTTKFELDDDFDRFPPRHLFEVSQVEDADATCLACRI